MVHCGRLLPLRVELATGQPAVVRLAARSEAHGKPYSLGQTFELFPGGPRHLLLKSWKAVGPFEPQVFQSAPRPDV